MALVGRVTCGDCLELMAAIPDGSVDMILCDPPYGHNNNNGDLIARRELALGRKDIARNARPRPILNDGAEATPLFEAFVREAARVLRKESVPTGARARTKRA